MSMPQKATVISLNLGGTKFTYKGNDYTLRICGRFQVTNAILAIEAATVLLRNGYKIEQSHIVRGLQKTALPSKFEILSVSPTIIIDSTYAPIAIETVCDSMEELKQFTGNRVRLCLTTEELCEQYEIALKSRGYEIESIISLPSPYAEDSEEKIYDDATICKTPKSAAKTALSDLSPNLTLLVSGRTNLSEKIRYEILSILGF